MKSHYRPIAVIMRELDAVQVKLSNINRACAPLRRELRQAQETLFEACIELDERGKLVLDWRAPGPPEIAVIDEIAARKYREVGPLEIEHKVLKRDESNLRHELAAAVRAARRSAQNPQGDLFENGAENA